jgi:hypothetical protein
VRNHTDREAKAITAGFAAQALQNIYAGRNELGVRLPEGGTTLLGEFGIQGIIGSAGRAGACDVTPVEALQNL